VTIVSLSAINGAHIGDVTNFTATVVGSGFFIKGSYIVTSAFNILLVAGEVVNFPPFSALFNSTTVIDHLPPYQGSRRAERIFVQVRPTIAPAKLVIYEAQIVAVDMAGDIALLKILPCGVEPNEGLNATSGWNDCNPCLKCQNYLSWGDSNCAEPGSNAFVFGTVPNQNDPEIFQAKVRDNHYVDATGRSTQELIALDEFMSFGLQGAPILNPQGCVVGMVTYVQNKNAISNTIPSTITAIASVMGDISFGPNECFISRVLKHLFEAEIVCNENFNRFLEWVPDTVACGFYRYVKGFIGISYRVAQAIDYIQAPYPAFNQPACETNPVVPVLSVEDCSERSCLNECEEEKVCPKNRNAFEISPFDNVCSVTDVCDPTKLCIFSQTTVTTCTQPPDLDTDAANSFGFVTYFRSANNLCFLTGGLNGILITSFYQDQNIIAYAKNCPRVNHHKCGCTSSSSSTECPSSSSSRCCKSSSSSCSSSSSSSSKFVATNSDSTTTEEVLNEYVLQINDIITHINKRPLGTAEGQIPPSAVTWFLVPFKGLEDINDGCSSSSSSSSSEGCSVTQEPRAKPLLVNISYRKYNDCNDCTGEPQPYVHEYEGLIKLNRYPLDVDLPQSVNVFTNATNFV
jgi:hypothetical protein